MEIGGLVGGLYRFFEWVMRLSYLNILWIVFTLLGLIIFGVAPASAAMFTVTRKWVMGQQDIPVFSTFWRAYRKDFVKVNVIGFMMLLIGFMLIVDIKFFQRMDSLVLYILSLIFWGILFMYFAALLYLFPVFAHYEMKNLQYIKFAFLSAVSHPFQSVLMVVSLVTTSYVVALFPGLLPVLSIAPLSFILMWIAYRIFSKADAKTPRHDIDKENSATAEPLARAKP